jgi:hypothetical protein
MKALLAILVAAAAFLAAQEPAQIRKNVIIMRQSDGNVGFVSAEMMPGSVIKSAPYSAQAVNEFTQTLGDGTRIHRKSSGGVYRDSEGRTRREEVGMIGAMLPAGDMPQLTFISDPVAGVSYVLNATDKTAQRSEIAAGTFSLPVAPPPAGVGAVGPTVVQHRSAGVVAAGMAGDFATFRTSISSAQNTRPESLGTKSIEGVQAEGTRTTTVIPAGEIGNDRPIETVFESWYSTQLKTVVMSRQSDPRMGDTVFRLTGITLGEPSRSLFEVPAGYSVISGPKMPTATTTPHAH